MRSCLLHLKVALRGLGPVPPAILLIFCAAASIQEPAFFRDQGLDLLWPACAVSADFLTLAAFSTWLGSTGSFYCLAYPWSAAAALLLLALVTSGSAVLACGLLDLAHDHNLDPSRMLAVMARPVLLWAPISLLVATTGCASIGCRVGVLVLSFAIQEAVHGVSMTAAGPGLGNVLATTLALSGSAAIALAHRGAQRGSAS